MKRGKFALQTLEYRINARWKKAVVARFEMCDLRPQALYSNLIRFQNIHF